MKKFEVIREECIADISVLPVGTVIPSVRELMRRFDVSQATIMKALRQIKQLGLIESKIGVGTVRINPSREVMSHSLKIGLVISDYHSAFTDALRKICEAYFARRNCSFECHCVADAKLLAGKFKFNSNCDAWLVNMNKDFNYKILEQLSHLTIPVVCLDIMPFGVNIDAVCADNSFGGAMVADYFVKKGHTAIGLLPGQPDSHSSRVRNTGFLRQLELAGVESVVVDCHTRSGENSTNKSYESFKAHIAAHELNFSALFCDSDLGALGVFRACYDLGIVIPDELEVIGFDNIHEGQYLKPTLSTVDQNLEEWVAVADQIIRTRLTRGDVEIMQCLVKPQLILRESVKP